MPSFAARLRRSVPLAACLATGLLVAAASVAQAKVRERPYFRHTPAYVCFKSTLSNEGQMVQNEMIRSSGSREGDRHARRLVTDSYFTENTGLQGEPRDVHVPMAREQVHVFLGHLGIRRADPDYHALVVMDHVLGTGPGFTNRVAMRLRDELGLAYTVSANIHGSAGSYPGTFKAYIGTSPDKVRTAIEGFRAEMRRLQDERVGDAELGVAKDYVVGSFALSFQRASRRAEYMIAAERFSLPADNLESAPRLYAAVTSDDLLRVARKHLHPDRCCIAAAGPLRDSDLG